LGLTTGGPGLDTIVFTGLISNYSIYYSGSNPTKYTFYYKANGTPSTWNYDARFYVYEIEKWEWSTTGIPSYNGAPEPITTSYYITEQANSSLTTSLNTTFINTLPTTTFYTLPLDVTLNTAGTIWFRFMPKDVQFIKVDAGTANEKIYSSLIIKNDYDNNDVATGIQYKEIKIPMTTGLHTVEMISTVRQIIQSEIDYISITPTVGP